MEIQWFGHSAFRIGTAGKTILLDPFLTDNATCPPDPESAFDKVDYIAVSHGHWDHLGDTVRLAKDYGAQVVAIAEICTWLTGQGVETCVRMNMGGTVTLDGVAFSMVNALHSSSLMGEAVPIYMGVCAGFVIKAGKCSVYHAGDTDIFSDMALIQRIHKPNVGLIPIGGHFTMDPETAALACNEFLDLEVIVPAHYKTFPVLVDNAEGFKGLVKRGRVEILEPGQTLKL